MGFRLSGYGAGILRDDADVEAGGMDNERGLAPPCLRRLGCSSGWRGSVPSSDSGTLVT